MKAPKRFRRASSDESEDSYEDNSSDEEVRMDFILKGICLILI